MEHLFYLSIIVFSLTYAIIESPFPLIAKVRQYIKEKFKNNKSVLHLISCYHCTGFQVGLLIGILYGIFNPFELLFFALYSAGVSLLVYRGFVITVKLEKFLKK